MVKSHLCFLSSGLPIVLLILTDLYRCACFPLQYPGAFLGTTLLSSTPGEGESPVD